MRGALGVLAVVAALAMQACGGEDPEAPPVTPAPVVVQPTDGEVLARSAWFLDGFPFAGSSVYLGDGWTLSNWHVAVSAALFALQAQSLGTDIPLSDYLDEYEVGTASALPKAGAISADDLYCLTASTATTAAQYRRVDGGQTPRDEELCVPVLLARTQFARPTWFAPDSPKKGGVGRPQLMWTDRALDLSIYRVPTASVTATAGELNPILIGADVPLVKDQRVWVIGYPRTVLLHYPFMRAVVELCSVVDPEVRVLRDPDLIQPSVLEVPSFMLDCASIEAGSSGSPVIDVATGRLLGLVWTTDGQGFTYATAARAWKQFADERGHAGPLGTVLQLGAP